MLRFPQIATIRAVKWRMMKQCYSAQASAKTITSQTDPFEVGSKHHGFTVKQSQKIDAFAMQAIYMEHDQTKAKYLHLARDDSNNVFSINFRTTPLDSTGLPHILEHTVLCGSKQFPVKDPFFKMLNRSLATFMNAMTAPDFTFYPFSTVNRADYQNLQKVYLDAALEPLLSEWDFKQEGWRLEHENVDDPNSKIIIKGVVYNEMKGVFGDNDQILSRALLNNVMPDHTYGVESGGDPLVIPQLTWNDLKSFHKRFYRPSNCHVYSYGNLDIQPTLSYLNEKFHQVGRAEVIDTAVPSQKRWSKPRRVNVTGKVDTLAGDLDKQNAINISLLMTDVKNVYENFLLMILTELLTNGPSAPFYKSMIELNISGGYTAATGFENQTRDTVFTVGLKKLAANDFDRVVDIFDRTLSDVVTSGFDKRHVDSILHRIELSLKHESDNFGLKMLFGVAALMNHDGDVLEALRVNELIDRFKLEMTDETYLKRMVDKYFVKNTHRLILTQTVDPNYETKMNELETKMLSEKIQALTAEDLTKIYADGLTLRDEQSKTGDLSLLPTLKLSDIPETIDPTAIRSFNDIRPIQVCAIHTPVTYLKMIVNVDHLRGTEFYQLLPLFTFVVDKLGTAKRSYGDFDLWTNEKTSGLSIDTEIVNDIRTGRYESRLLMSSFALDGNLSDMLHIWYELFNNQTLDDVKRFDNLLQMYTGNLTSGLTHNGHRYAMQLAKSFLNASGHDRETLFGIEHIKFIRQLTANKSPAEILTAIKQMAALVFDRERMRVAVNTQSSRIDETITLVQDFIGELNSSGKSDNPGKVIDEKPRSNIAAKHVVINAPVFYCSKAIETTPYVHVDYPKLQVLSNLLTFKYLHKIVREKNGAYGGGCAQSMDGSLAFYSYRDPNSLVTHQVFDESLDFIMKNVASFNDQDIFEAKLGIFKDLDRPVTAQHRGDRLFLYGIDDALLAKRRLDVLGVTLNDVKEVAEKYLSGKKKCGKAIIGPKVDDVGNGWIVDENDIS